MLLVGNGKMGSSFVPLLKNEFKISVVSPNTKPQVPVEAYFRDLSEADSLYDYVVWAVKPQVLPKVIPTLRPSTFDRNTTFISMVAGANIEFFRNSLGRDAKVVRIMPNLPCSIGRGIVAMYPHADIQFLEKLGKVLPVDVEEDIDHFTSFTGSGSGFCFSIFEMYMKSAKKLNITTKIDEYDIILDMFEGAIQLMRENKASFDEMKLRVATPNGTTFAGLKHLNQCQDLFDKGLLAASLRARELAEETQKGLQK
jgi:pyrroline-5-carboxylate reductase